MKIGTISCLMAACGLAGAASAQITLSRSTVNNLIVAGNSVACATAAGDPPQRTTSNFYWRSYKLSDFPAVTGPFNVQSVTFGVEDAAHPTLTQDVRVRLYKDTDGGVPTAVGTDLTQVAEALVAVPDGQAQFITCPIVANFAQTDTIVVSVDSQDWQLAFPSPTTVSARFFIGSNNLGETDPSYLSAVPCGIANPTNTTTIGFPNMMIILDLTGTVGAAACYPDCNGDSVLNLSDFGCFTTKFALGDAYADCNGDGIRNLSDFGCFTTKFALGCP
ncbi:MAG: hypothetical protein IT437_02055 [Phycisphaerales bacterium]|nr:hypothetical protein [Phycisphaerales bacterium]